MSDIEQLNTQFGIPGRVAFVEGPGGLPVVEMVNGVGKTAVSLHGGHVLSYMPHDQASVLWMSQLAEFAPGKAIRGGIPVIWPWFGSHPSDSSKPSHGFARRQLWAVQGVEAAGDHRQLTLSLSDSPESRAIWPHHFLLTLQVTLDAALHVELTTSNTGRTPFVITQALHSYFTISEIKNIAITGLEQCAYLDQLDEMRRKRQPGAITFAEEVDRIYIETTGDCVLHDSGLNRSIRVAKRGSGSTVIWNPWVAKAQRMADFGDEEYRAMVCIETTNAADDQVTILPGEGYRLTAVISVEPYEKA
ncbi:MAG: D-hexose-6-phosphate mutarotase [Chloroflexota bacterium]